MKRPEMLQLQRELVAQGFVIRNVGEWPKKATYYKPNGEAMPGLPADPYSMKRYLARGFTLVPPTEPVASGNGDFVCECGKPCASRIGLFSHKRTHEKEST